MVAYTFTSDRLGLLIIYNASIIKQKSKTQKLKTQLITAYFKSTEISSLWHAKDEKSSGVAGKLFQLCITRFEKSIYGHQYVTD